MRKLALVAALISITAVTLSAQDNSELLTRLKAMEDRIKSLEAEVQSLKGQQAAVTPAPTPTPLPPTPAEPQLPAATPTPVTESPSLGGAGAAAAKAFNPDISVIGDFLGAAGNSGGRPTPSLEMHESEVGLQAIIDPYARADFFISFGEQGVNLEEGYITFTALPYGLQLRAGKMRAAFGKVNTLHNHVLPWTDRPLVTQNLVAGEDGINDAGLSLSRILPAPKGIFLEGTAQLFRGDTDGLFRAATRRKLSNVDHLRAYHDFSESTNLDLGASYAVGHSPYGDSTNQLYGIDATMRWKPLRRSIYHSFVGRGEFIWARGQMLPNLPTPTWVTLDPVTGSAGVGPRFPVTKPFGFYVSGDYQLGRRWFLGGRFDRSQRPNGTPILLQDTGGSLVVTYWPSEFAQIRGQLRRTQYGDSHAAANEFLFQIQFSMGAHGAHPF